MPKAKRIVVDASVSMPAGSSYEPSGTARACREVLDVILDCHLVVFSAEGFREFENRASRYARRWLSRMESKRRVSHHTNQSNKLRRQLERVPGTKPTETRAMLKDAHLLDAAIATDRVVLSRDEKARALFRRAAESLAEVGKVHWGNPEIEQEGVTVWLRSGAKLEHRRALGAPAL